MQGPCSRTPEFRIVAPAVRAASQGELEDIFRFRYAHHFHGFPDGYPGLERGRSRVFEPHDLASVHYCALDAAGRLAAVSTATPAAVASIPDAWREWLRLDRFEPLGLDRVVVSTRLVVRPDLQGSGLFRGFHRFIMRGYLEAGYRCALHFCSPGLVCRYERLGHRTYADPFVLPAGTAGLLREPMLMDLGDPDYLARLGSPVADLCVGQPPSGGRWELAGLLPDLRDRANFRLLDQDGRRAYVRARLGPAAKGLGADASMPALEFASPLVVRAGQSHTPPPGNGLLCLVLDGTFREAADHAADRGPGTFLGCALLREAETPPPFTALTPGELLVFDAGLTRAAACRAGAGSGHAGSRDVWRALDNAARAGGRADTKGG